MMRDGKPKFIENEYGNPQPSPDDAVSGKVQRLSRKRVLAHTNFICVGKRLGRHRRHDIVHPLKKFRDKCKDKVAGSSPASGAKIKNPVGFFIFDNPLFS